MNLTEFKDYDDYVKAQLAATNRKMEVVYFFPHELDAVARYLLKYIPEPQFGICHGARTGQEVQHLQEKLPNTQVLGTDIHPEAAAKNGLIHLDFHETLPGWENHFDFIYSNSFDHSHSPDQCLQTWLSCLKPHGLLFLHWGHDHAPHDKMPLYSADCFRATEDEYKALIARHGVLKKFLVLPDVPGKNKKTGNDKRMHPRRMFVVGRKDTP